MRLDWFSLSLTVPHWRRSPSFPELPNPVLGHRLLPHSWPQGCLPCLAHLKASGLNCSWNMGNGREEQREKRKKGRWGRKRKQYFIERWTLSVTGCRGSGGCYVFHRGFHLLLSGGQSTGKSSRSSEAGLLCPCFCLWPSPGSQLEARVSRLKGEWKKLL